jgi:hypothetical protein
MKENKKSPLIKINKKSNKKVFFTWFINLLEMSQSKEKKLTDMQREILIEFMALPEKYKYDRFSTKARKKVVQIVQEKYNKNYVPTWIGTNITRIKNKGYIVLNEDENLDLAISLERILNVKDIEINFKFEINE